MAENAQPDKSSEKSNEVTAQGVSHLIAKVLEQLSLSSWLPATILVAHSAVLLQLYSQSDLDIGKSLTALTMKPLGILVVLVFSLILAAVVCQAFSFGAIKILEGYWGRSWPGATLFALGVRLQHRKLKMLAGRNEVQRMRAFSYARENMLRNSNIDWKLVRILEADEYGRTSEIDYTEEEWNDATEVGWKSFSSPILLGRLEGLDVSLYEFPEPHRLLPTKLGNVMRSYEDSINNSDDSLEGFVIRKGDRVDVRQKVLHDHHRGRLEMYSTLVFVYGLLGVVSAILLSQSVDNTVGVCIVVALTLVLCIVSYYAAISSARAYGGTLVEMAKN